MFPKSNINEQTEVIVLSKQYLTDISAIISSTDRQYVKHAKNFPCMESVYLFIRGKLHHLCNFMHWRFNYFRTLNNYVMWHLFKKFLPYLSRDYAESYDMFLREISGISLKKINFIPIKKYMVNYIFMFLQVEERHSPAGNFVLTKPSTISVTPLTSSSPKTV